MELDARILRSLFSTLGMHGTCIGIVRISPDQSRLDGNRGILDILLGKWREEDSRLVNLTRTHPTMNRTEAYEQFGMYPGRYK